MAKITAQNIKDLGWIPEQLKQTSATFDTFLAAIITEQADILAALIGADVYASTETSIAPFVKKAERCLVEAELWRRRITTKDAREVAGGSGDNKWSEHQSFDAVMDEAESLISRLTGSGLAFGALESSHYDA